MTKRGIIFCILNSNNRNLMEWTHIYPQAKKLGIWIFAI